MPYGLPKDIGGDSKENEEWMMRCIAGVMKDGKTSKQSAIAVCKSTLIKKKKKGKEK